MALGPDYLPYLKLKKVYLIQIVGSQTDLGCVLQPRGGPRNSRLGGWGILPHGRDKDVQANRVKGGVRSYQRSARLLMVYARFNEGSCVAPGPEIPM